MKKAVMEIMCLVCHAGNSKVRSLEYRYYNSRPMVAWLRDRPRNRRVDDSIPETND